MVGTWKEDPSISTGHVSRQTGTGKDQRNSDDGHVNIHVLGMRLTLLAVAPTITTAR